MLTRKRWRAPNFTGDARQDYANLSKSISDYLISLEGKNSLTLSQAQIYVDQGLQFPATQVASSDVNNLDDYVEKNWTPTDGSGAGLTLTVNSAKCTKWGRVFLLEGDITYPVTANGATAFIAGPPYTPSTFCIGSCLMTGGGGFNVVQLTTTPSVAIWSNTAGAAATNAQMSGLLLRFCIVGQV